MDDEWDKLPDGSVQVALFAGYGVAVAAPHAAAVRIVYVRDAEAAQADRREAFQVALTRVHLEDLGNALLAAARELAVAQGASSES